MFYHVIKSYLLVNNCSISFKCFCFKFRISSFICSVVFNCLGHFRSLIFMKYMFMTKCSALVYINDFVCGLEKQSQGRGARWCSPWLWSYWQWGATEATTMVLRLTVNLLFRALSPWGSWWLRESIIVWGVLHFTFGLHWAKPALVPTAEQRPRALNEWICVYVQMNKWPDHLKYSCFSGSLIYGAKT